MVHSYFWSFSFLFRLKYHHAKDENLTFGWKGQAIWMYEIIVCVAVIYLLLHKLI